LYSKTIFVASAIFSFAIWGCGRTSSDHPELGEVTGTVTLDGKELANADVTFLPEQGRGSSGVTDTSGSYSLRYTGTERGAIVGKHSVRITTAIPTDTSTRELLPDKYHVESELSFEVNSGKNVANFHLDSN